MTPRVAIVGAGPGDPALISVRGLQCLERADVVIYDHRVSERLLRAAPKHAERIDVGAAAPKPLDQDAIGLLVVEKAREGKRVVRLKWGDPFVFDSGGKETLLLHEHHVPFEVVPGIPLTIAGPAYAGIPITYPGAGDTLIFIRENEAETDAPAHVDWKHVAALGGTVLCFAGAHQIPGVVRALTAHGRSHEESAALVYDATLPMQHTVSGTLADVAERALPGRPALLIVGRVAGFREHLRWFDRRPLFGRRVVVTRSSEQAGELTRLLDELGAETIAVPTIRIVPGDEDALNASVDSAHEFDWIVLTSVNGVEHFMSRLLARRDIRDLKGVRLCAVGPATAAALEKYGVRVDFVPKEHRGEAVLSGLIEQGGLSGKRLLLPRADIAREMLADELRKAGAEVVDVVAYRTIPAEETLTQEVYRLLLDRQIDAVTFSSASTVRNFVELLGPDQAADLLRTVTVAAIGPVTAEAAQQMGIHVSVMPSTYTIPALAQALVEHLSQNSARFAVQP